MGWFNKKELAEIAQLKGIVEKLKAEKKELHARLEQLEELPSKAYKVRNTENNIRRFYRTKLKFFSPNESKLFEILSATIIEKELSNKNYFVFPQVRLADIVENWPDIEDWDKFKNSKHKDLVEEIEQACRTMDEDKYENLVVHPILPLHIDFLICKKDGDIFTPALAIELDGEEHNKKNYSDKKTRNKMGLSQILCKPFVWC